MTNGEPATSDKPDSNFWKVFLCALFLGGFGVHRFVTGKNKSGVIQLLTFGGCGLWALIDLVTILLGKFKGQNGIEIKNPNPRKTWSIAAGACLLGVLLNSAGNYGKYYYADSRVIDELEINGSSFRITRIFKSGDGGESESGTCTVEKTEGDVVYMSAQTTQHVGGMEIPSSYILAIDTKADTVLLKMSTSAATGQAIKEMGLSDSRLFARKEKVLKE